MKTKIIGILVMVLLIVTAFPALGLAEENKKCEISCLKIEDPRAISTTMLDQVDQQQTTYTGEERIQELNNGGLAQSFKPSVSPLTKVSVSWIKSTGTPEFAYYFIEIRSDIHSTSYLRKIQIDMNQIQTGLWWYNWDFSDLAVTIGNTYWIVCYASTATIYSTQVKWCYGSPGDPYPDGGSMINYGPPLYWSAYDIFGDFCFKTYGISGGGNNPPNKPTTPSGPTTGNVGDSLHYESYISDPDGDGMEVYFDWGDGTHTGWVGILTNGTVGNYKTWTTANTYQVRVKTRDTPYLEESPWSDPLSVTIGNGGNTQPNKPETPDGPTSGKTGTSYSYSSSTTDPDGDQVWYKWDWGDEVSNWDGPYNSGDLVTQSHIWSNQGTYAVKVKAKDTSDVESVWSDPLSISMPKSKPYINSLFLNFLENHPHLFPLLRQLLRLQ